MSDFEDRILVQDVMLRYAAGLDDQDYAMYESCFTDDVEVIGMGSSTIHGVTEWVTFVKAAMSRYEATQHMLGPQLATIDGDKATTRTDLQARHYLKGQQGKTFTLWATYFTEMVRINGEWKIKKHRLVTRGSQTE